MAAVVVEGASTRCAGARLSGAALPTMTIRHFSSRTTRLDRTFLAEQLKGARS
jgi:hypothetical protein